MVLPETIFGRPIREIIEEQARHPDLKRRVFLFSTLGATSVRLPDHTPARRALPTKRSKNYHKNSQFADMSGSYKGHDPNHLSSNNDPAGT